MINETLDDLIGIAEGLTLSDSDLQELVQGTVRKFPFTMRAYPRGCLEYL